MTSTKNGIVTLATQLTMEVNMCMYACVCLELIHVRDYQLLVLQEGEIRHVPVP